MNVISTSGFDGRRSVEHVIKRGETLSSVARRYGFSSYEPIWTYNSAILGILSGSPNEIREGIRIFIPRTPSGYRIVVNDLASIQSQLDGMTMMRESELDIVMYEAKAIGTMFDFASDVAATVGTLGAKAYQAAKAARVAREAESFAKFAAKYVSGEEARSIAGTLERFNSDLGELQAQVIKAERYLAKQAIDAYKKKARSKLSDAGYKLVCEYLDDLLEARGVDSRPFDVANKTRKTVTKGATAIRTFTNAGKMLLDAADIILDYAKPSAIANGWLYLTSSETLNQTIENQRKRVREDAKGATERVAARIKQLDSECQTVWGVKIKT